MLQCCAPAGGDSARRGPNGEINAGHEHRLLHSILRRPSYDAAHLSSRQVSLSQSGRVRAQWMSNFVGITCSPPRACLAVRCEALLPLSRVLILWSFRSLLAASAFCSVRWAGHTLQMPTKSSVSCYILLQLFGLGSFSEYCPR